MASNYFTILSGRTRVDLFYEPNSTIVDVQIIIYNTSPSSVVLTDFSTDQIGICKNKQENDFHTHYTFYAPTGTRTFSRMYRVNCRKHTINLTAEDEHGTTSQSTAVAILDPGE